jgi:FkbM family methyltransferase
LAEKDNPMSWPANKEHIRAIYKTLLKREPDEVGMKGYLALGDIDTVIEQISNSAEAKALDDRNSPFYHFNSKIDVAAVVKSYEKLDREPVAGRIVNYLGVIIDPAYLLGVLDGRQDTVEGVPIPANWHADMAEFGAALRAVDLATETFRVVELGCGWGCWLLNTGVAARNKGLKTSLIGAEGDLGHVKFAQRACEENGFDQSQATIYQRVVGPKHGVALFPKQETSGEQWNLEAVFDATKAQIAKAKRSGKYDILDIVTLEDFVDKGEVIDLVHMDIQGVEADFIDNCAQTMNDIVCYVVVGTHSRQIEGRIFQTMVDNGWVLEVERPGLLELTGPTPAMRVDGVQGWRNPRLRPL